MTLGGLDGQEWIALAATGIAKFVAMAALVAGVVYAVRRLERLRQIPAGRRVPKDRRDEPQ